MRRLELRAKSNNISQITKKLNAEGSLMQPIAEEARGAGVTDLSNSKSKSRKSMDDVSKGRILPNIPSKLNKTMTYEIYSGSARDMVKCP
jgi:hypothetical protein